jgi:4-hydroxy-4-methyl-2-oxoglutarate aldolase
MPEITKRLLELPAAIISDTQRSMQTTYAVDPAIHNMVPGTRLAGPAFTVLARSGSIITVHKALLEAPPGCVLVVGGETGQSANGALFGKLMATQARLRGILGIVVDGPLRDVVDLREMAFPAFARGATPHVGLNRVVGQTQVPVPCGGILVNPGDYILGDDDGLAIIPAGMAESIVSMAEDKLQKEAAIIARMQAGERLTDIIGFTELIYAGQAAPKS